jgi:hypothetical protein
MAAFVLLGTWGSNSPPERLDVAQTSYYIKNMRRDQHWDIMCTEYKISIITFNTPNDNRRDYPDVYMNPATVFMDIVFLTRSMWAKVYVDDIVQMDTKFRGLTYMICDYNSAKHQPLDMLNGDLFGVCSNIIPSSLSMHMPVAILHSHNGNWEKTSATAIDIAKLNLCGCIRVFEADMGMITYILYSMSPDRYMSTSVKLLRNMRPQLQNRNMAIITRILQSEHIYIISGCGTYGYPDDIHGNVLQYLYPLFTSEQAAMWGQEPADDSNLTYDE